MAQQMIVTNLRMPKDDYLQAKAMAGELGMSVNEYIRILVTSSATKRTMAKKPSFHDAMLSLAEAPSGQPDGLSDDDETTYAV